MRLRFFVLLLLLPCMATAQDNETKYVSAFRDYRNYLYVFQNASMYQLETQPVRSYKANGDIAAYVNSANNLIVWYNGEKINLDDVTNTVFTISEKLLIYQRDQVLVVFDKGKITRLTYFIRDYKINEGMVAFRDANVDILKVYYKGEIKEIESTLIGTVGDFKVGKNTLAYVNNMNYFKVYHEGETFELDNLPPVDFVAGKDIVAYIDGTYQALKAYYDNKVVMLENIKPQSFQAGDGIIAYVSDEGYFKIFYDGKLVKAASYPPDFYLVKDSTVAFFADNQMQLFKNGKRQILDYEKPQSYKISQNNVAWVDNVGRLHLYSNGKTYNVTSELFSFYELNGDVLRYEIAGGVSKIFYRGNTY